MDGVGIGDEDLLRQLKCGMSDEMPCLIFAIKQLSTGDFCHSQTYSLEMRMKSNSPTP